MVVKGIFYLHHLVSDFRSVPAEPGEVAKDFPHTPILLCRLLDRACDNQQCLLYPIILVSALVEKMQHITAAACCGTCSGHEILGRSFALQEEKEQNQNQT